MKSKVRHIPKKEHTNKEEMLDLIERTKKELKEARELLATLREA